MQDRLGGGGRGGQRPAASILQRLFHRLITTCSGNSPLPGVMHCGPSVTNNTFHEMKQFIISTVSRTLFFFCSSWCFICNLVTLCRKPLFIFTFQGEQMILPIYNQSQHKEHMMKMNNRISHHFPPRSSLPPLLPYVPPARTTTNPVPRYKHEGRRPPPRRQTRVAACNHGQPPPTREQRNLC